MTAPHPSAAPVLVRRVLRLADGLLALIEALLVAVLVAMIVLVFCNVVLRYGFNSGITITDEVSRMMFVWIAFVGAIAVSRRQEQLGVDFIVSALPAPARRILHVLASLTVLFCCAVLAYGAWGQMMLNLTNAAPISGVPMALTYAAPWLGGIGIGCVALSQAIGAGFGITPHSSAPEGPAT